MRYRSFLLLLITLLSACHGARFAVAQIFIDGFEKGIVGNKIGVGPDVHPYWVGSSVGTALYAAKPEEFTGGFTVARFYDQNDISGQTVFLETGPPTSYEAQLSGQVFTMSFNFLELAGTHFTPEGTADGPRGLFFGFSHDTAFPDLNNVSRSYAAQLVNGTIKRGGPTDAVVDTPASYAFDVVNTAFLMVNDSTNPLVNYVPGRSIASKQADIWVLRNGETVPNFAGTIQYNPAAAGTTPKFMGFRSFIDDRLHIVVDNLLLNSGASFNRAFDFGNRIPGDVNNDEVIDLADLQIIRDNFFDSVTGRQFGDLNEDGLVNYVDYRQWKNVYESQFQQDEGAGGFARGTVPEPSSMALILLVALQAMFCRFDRRHVL